MKTPVSELRVVNLPMRRLPPWRRGNARLCRLMVAVRRSTVLEHGQSTVPPGVSESVEICLAALLNPGENLLTPSPDYPLYSAVLAKLEIGLNTYDLNEDDGWQPELEDIKRKITPLTLSRP